MGPARGAPSPRRNHGFAPRLTEGAGAEAILCERRPGRGAQRRLHRAPTPRRPPKSCRQTPLPAPPTPRRRVWWRPRRHRRALPVSVSAVTRAALAPPGPRLPLPGRAALSRPTKGPRDAAGPAGAPDGGPRVEAAVTKRLLCRPARPAAAASPVRALRAGPTPPPAPPRARRGRGTRCLPRPTATPPSPASASPQPAATGRPQGRRLAPTARDPPKLRAKAAGNGRRALNKGGSRMVVLGRGGRSWSPGPRGGGATDTHRNMFTH